MSDEIKLVNSVNISKDDELISLGDTPVINKNSTITHTTPVPNLEPWHYFRFACYFILVDLAIIGILGVIAIACPSREHVATQLIQICFYPILTLILGYVFAKGIPENKK